MAKALNIILAIIVVVLGYSNYQQGQKIEELYIKNAELSKSKNNEVSSPSEVAQNSTSKELTAKNSPRSSLAEDDQVQEAVDSAQTEQADNPAQSETPLDSMVKSDEMKEMMQSDFMKQQLKFQMKNQLPPLYEDLFDELQLDEEQRQALLDLMINDKVEEAQYAMAFAYKSGDELDKLEEYQSSDEYNEQLEDLLGSDGVGTLDEYEKTLPIRQEMMMFNAQVAPDLALSKEQVSMMIDSVSQVRKPESFDDSKNMMSLIKDGNMEEVRAMLKQKQDAALEQSANILTEQQQTSYQNYLNQQLEMQIVGLKMMSKM